MNKINKTMKPNSEEVRQAAQDILAAVKKIAPELGAVAKKTPFEIVITNDEKGLGIEFSVDWDPTRDDKVEEAASEEELRETLKASISKALTESKGNYKQAAERLGMSVRSLKRHLAALNL